MRRTTPHRRYRLLTVAAAVSLLIIVGTAPGVDPDPTPTTDHPIVLADGPPPDDKPWD